MRYVDIINSNSLPEQKLVRELGFSKILNANEQILILDKISQPQKPFLISSTNPNIVNNLLKSPNAIGILSNGEELDPRIVNKIKENDKIIIFNAYYLAISSRDRISKVHKLRKIFKMAYKVKARTAIITLAPSQTYFLSSIQLLEIAKMICTDDHQAKKMLLLEGDITK